MPTFSRLWIYRPLIDLNAAIVDHSINWDWTACDYETRYKAVKVHIGEVTREVAAQKLGSSAPRSLLLPWSRGKDLKVS